MENLIKIYKEGNFRMISNNMIEVLGHTVSKNKYLTCNCKNQAYSKQEGLCIHKKFYLYLTLFIKLDKFSQELEDYLNGADLVNSEYNKSVIRDFSDKLKRFEI